MQEPSAPPFVPRPVLRDPSPWPRRALMLALAALLAWIGIDLLAPRRVDIRVFDARRVAKLDTEMWRSYYDRKPVLLFFQLAELMRDQFHFPFLRSHLAAFHAAKAAFVFKDGAGRADYERAIPDLVRYYAQIRALSTTPFDVRRTAELELEWWIVHRERLLRQGGDLEQALADAAAELYEVPSTRLRAYAKERAIAMWVRDTGAARGALGASGWREIERRLVRSWTSLREAVGP